MAEMTSLRTLMPGLLLSIALAALAAILGSRYPVVGAPIFAIAFGILVRGFVAASALNRGVAFAARTLLQAGIVLLGFGLNLALLWRAGASSLPVLAGSLAAGLLGGLLLGSLMRIGFNIRMLVAAGTSICGASAIAAIAPIIEADGGDVAFATATIFLYNIVAVFLFPPLGHALHMSQTV
ncbi:MAG TPA: putative sulfate exporter family transporter, partial [Candidatus Eremiobacteraceae bacterium]|nr:putative sulfate exporter family transporter [Candidatus Eremiobacteraceae bacterium]